MKLQPGSISQTIAISRFPLILLIVLLHCGIQTESPSIHINLWAIDIVRFFSDTIARVAVPLFFFFSGFLFFYGKKPDTPGFFRTQLRRRVKTLLIPYLLWNLIAILLTWAKTGSMTLSTFVNAFGPFTFTPSHGALGIYDPSSAPADLPLWFIRDLMAIMLFSPLIYKILNSRCGIPVSIILLVLFLLGIWPDACFWFSLTGVCFFCFGALFAIRNLDPLVIPAKCPVFFAVGFVLAATARVAFYNTCISSYLIALTIVFGVPCFLLCCCSAVNRGFTTPEFLVKSTFFLYAAHLLFAYTIKQIVVALIPPANSFTYVVAYFFSFIAIVVVNLLLYYIFSKIFPRGAAILSGNR